MNNQKNKGHTSLAKSNEALRKGSYKQAIALYAEVIVQQPELAKSISANLSIARRRYRSSRQNTEKPTVAVCGWDLAHNAAGRVYTLATIYEIFAQVEIIGSIFPRFGREIWEPIRDTKISKHSFIVEDESKFIEQAIQLVSAHPYDIVHLSKPRAPNIFFGILYKILWGAKVLMDIDDEELAFVGAETPISIDHYIQQHGRLPELKDLAGKEWTRLAVGLAKEFDGVTVCNAPLQKRYGGEIIRHARDERLFKPSPELKRKSREKYGIPRDAKVVLFFGTPREHKGLIETAQVIASLKSPEVIYCIAGSFTDESLKQRLLEIKGCNYKLLPNQPVNKIPEILALADCCVLLQDKNSTAAQYQTPAKLSDALAMKVKVICNYSHGLTEFEGVPEVCFWNDEPLEELVANQLNNSIFSNTDCQSSAFCDLISIRTARNTITQVLENLRDESACPIENSVRLLSKYQKALSFASLGVSRLHHIKGDNINSARTVVNPIDLISQSAGLALVVPVFNAADELDECLKSIISTCDSFLRVIVINDNSTDSRVLDVLESYKHFNNVEIYQNAVNLGFSGTVNRGIKLAGDLDVIILNSDTKVTKGFYRRMVSLAYSEKDIGTVTPLSNNAGPFSIKVDSVNDEQLHSHASALARLSKTSNLDIPTAHGFCMLIRRDCIKDVGLFDAKAFPRGYGEENDFCMRATSKGWKHRLDDSTFIFHKKAASFLGDKDNLIKLGRAILDKRYPHYTKLVRDFVNSDGLKSTIDNATTAFYSEQESIDASGKRILYVIPKLGKKGGTPQTNADLMRGMRSKYHIQTYLLISDGINLELYNVNSNSDDLLDSHSLKEAIVPSRHTSKEYDDIFIRWVLKYSFDLIHFRHIALHSLSSINKLNELGVRTIYSFHDYYTLCPTVKLLDNQGKYCGGICSSSPLEGDCKVDVWKNNDITTLKNAYIYEWNAKLTKWIAHFDAYVTTSEFAKRLICERLQITKRRPFYVIPHGRDFSELIRPSEESASLDVLRVLVPGGINVAKGAGIVRELQKRLKGKVEFHILGTLAKDVGIIDGAKIHGEYDRDDFIKRVKSLGYRMHVGAIFSIWPETYCHTLTELWAAGLPVVALDYGAVGERIKESGAGWLVHESNNLGGLEKKLLEILANPKIMVEANDALRKWQRSEFMEKNVNWMAESYYQIYQNVARL